MKYYAGIGSRRTPSEMLSLFSRVAVYLAKNGYVLRSGAAPGADSAFEVGCDHLNGEKEIYLPWAGFQNSSSKLIVSSKEAYDIAKKYHPYWNNLKGGAKSLQARNVHQVLGSDFKTHSKFVICWTPNGSGEGGTGQAIRIAKDFNIPVFDCGVYADINECRVKLKEFLDLYM